MSPYACERSYSDDNFFDPDAADSQYTGLHLAVTEGHQDLARWLVKEYPQLLRIVDKDKKTPLMLATKKGDTAMCAILSGNETAQENTSAQIEKKAQATETAQTVTPVVLPPAPPPPKLE